MPSSQGNVIATGADTSLLNWINFKPEIKREGIKFLSNGLILITIE